MDEMGNSSKIVLVFGEPEGLDKKDILQKEWKNKGGGSLGGYTEKELISALEGVKNSIAKGSTREAIMGLDSCIVRISGKQLPENSDDTIKSTSMYKLDRPLP